MGGVKDVTVVHTAMHFDFDVAAATRGAIRAARTAETASSATGAVQGGGGGGGGEEEGGEAAPAAAVAATTDSELTTVACSSSISSQLSYEDDTSPASQPASAEAAVEPSASPSSTAVTTTSVVSQPAIPPSVSSSNPYEVDKFITTLYLESIPVKNSPLHNRLIGFTEVENVYIGDNSTISGPNAGRIVARFLGHFKKLKNVVLLPKNSDKTKFIDDLKLTCPNLHRLCLTKRHEQTDVVPPNSGRFAYNVVPPPSKKDILLTKVKWSVCLDDVDEESVVNADTAAAVARCTLECNFANYTRGLYVYK